MVSKSDNARLLQSFLVIWLDSNINEQSEYCQNTKTQLQSIVNDINIFTKPDPCIDFLTDIDDRNVFMIISRTIDEQIVPLIHDIPQLDTIYILSDNESRIGQSFKEWFKVKNEYTQITSICEALKQATKQYDRNSIAISFVSAEDGSSNPNLDQLDPSFMYTQIFKEILFEMKYNQQSIKNLVLYWRSLYIGNESQLSIIDRFECEYCPQSSIWWYTCYPFIYEILNRALRTIEADMIIKMGFYIQDLHLQIKELHAQQFSGPDKVPFSVYRGQTLKKEDFEKLVKTKGGLISFNNFLSTSKDRQISLLFANSVPENSDNVSIFFDIIIDSPICSSPFALIKNVSQFADEQEVLFSMHSVFRIGEITQIDDNPQLYQVDLKLTSDDDQQLRILTDHIRKEIPGSTGWERLGNLLNKLSQYDMAEEMYKVLLGQTLEEQDQAIVFNGIGCTKAHQGNYTEAIWYCEQAKEIWQKRCSPDDPRLALSYQNIASVYRYMGEYSTAFSLCEKALEILQKTLPPNDSKLTHSYYEIASLYNNMGEYSNALLFYKKVLNIYEKTLPRNHPDLASSYDRIGEVYNSIGDHWKALSFHNKALDIYQRSLPSNHPKLAHSNNNIGEVYLNMGQYLKARLFYDKALGIFEKSLLSNQSDWAFSYEKIGTLSYKLGEYSKALFFYKIALGIDEKAYPQYHPNLAITYNNIGGIYFTTGEYSKAISFYEKALGIYKKTRIPNQPALAASYNNIGLAYRKMNDHSKALSFLNIALEILQKVLPPNHPNFADSYNNIGLVHMHMREYSKALSLFNKALEIFQETLSANHPRLATSYNYIYLLYCHMGEYSKALPFGERAFEISQLSLPANHPDLQILRDNLDIIRKKL